MLNILSAGVLGLVVSFIAFVAALIVHSKQKKNPVDFLKIKIKRYRPQSVKDAQRGFSALICKLTVGMFSNQLLNNYRGKMISSQPIDNDRILPGYGKTHTLSAIAAVGKASHPVPAIIDQVGDIFS